MKIQDFSQCLEVCVSVHNFERRWCWQLSSLVEQDMPVLVTAGYIKGTGSPEVPEIAEYFNKLGSGLHVRTIPYDGHERFQFRGLVRNDMVTASVGKRLLFTDADMLVSKDWCRLALNPEFPDDRCLHTGRYSTILEPTNEVVNALTYPDMVHNAFGLVSGMEAVKKADIGAGFCQIIGGDFIRKRGFYIENNRDGRWDKKTFYASDRQFRVSVGKTRVPLPYMFHLQHERDSTACTHLTHQR